MQPSEDSSEVFSIQSSLRNGSEDTKHATDTGRITRTLAEELEWWPWELELYLFPSPGEEKEGQLVRAQYKVLGVVLGRLLRMQPSEDFSEVSSIKARRRKDSEATKHATDNGKITRTLAEKLEWWTCN
jgi:hypothetical protein